MSENCFLHFVRVPQKLLQGFMGCQKSCTRGLYGSFEPVERDAGASSAGDIGFKGFAQVCGLFLGFGLRTYVLF